MKPVDLKFREVSFRVQHPESKVWMPTPEPGWEQALITLVPEHLQTGLAEYVTHGMRPGAFLCAVIDDQLREAIMRADPVSQFALRGVVTWLYNYAPSASYGSRAARAYWEQYGIAIAAKVAEALVQHSPQI
jgi:hypothetical protein